MRIRPSVVLAATATALLTAACTGGGAQSSSGGGGGDTEGASLRYLVEEPEDAAAVQRLEDHLADFTEQSGIEVELETLPWETMNTTLQTQLRSGEGPDVFNWGSGPSFGGALAENGLLYDLTDAYEENGWEVYDFAVERVSSDGKIWGIPGEMETIGLFYNAAILDEVGVEPPQSLDDLREVAAAVKEAGYVPLAAADQEGWEGGHYLSMALSSAVGSERMEALMNGEESWESPEVVDALRFWQEANENGWLVESPTAVNYDTATAQFFSGEAAMIPTGSWLVNEINTAMGKDAEIGYIPFPGPDGEGIWTSGLGSGPFVSASTDNPEAALELIDFLASEEHGRWTVENLQTIPPQPIDTEGLDVTPLFAEVLADVAELADGGDAGYNLDVMMTDDFNQAMFDGVQAILTDQSTPEEVAAQLQAAAQR